MKNSILVFLSLFTFMVGCDDNEPETSTVSRAEKYQVNRSEGISYAQANFGSYYDRSQVVAEDLRLDFYEPIGASAQNRPVILLLHSGGFSGGGRGDGAVINTAIFFASRGWVVYSIDYRLNGIPSLIPADWPPQSMLDELEIGADLSPSPFCEAVNQYDDIPDGCNNITEIVQIDSDDDIENITETYRTIYGASRDVKAAIRYIHATAVSFGADPDRITVMGSDAGAALALMSGVTNHGDYTMEVSQDEDPTIQDTTPDASEKVRSVVSFFGSTIAIKLIEAYYGADRYGNDASLFLWHGKQDNVVSFKEALDVLCHYESTGGNIEFLPQCGGHGLIDTISALEEAMEFIISDQSLRAE